MHQPTMRPRRHGILQRWRPRSAARVDLLCVPSAGAGATVYRQWPDALGPDVEVVFVQPPGRENRLRDAPHLAMAPLLDEILGALDAGPSRPLALFGHSMGASVAYEVARALVREGRPPLLLAVSGRRPPHRVERDLVATDDASLVDRLRRLGGTPPEVLESPELLQLLLPVLRADFTLLKTYDAAFSTRLQAQSRRQPEPLTCPLRVYGGTEDPGVPIEWLEEWSRYTRADSRLETFPGGHFFLHDEASGDALRASLRDALIARLNEL